ncbi:MAG: nucleoside-diphosphate-sugar epimerase [Acidimicrobiales bacterium]|nr:nucleoside-diphosphate-sugar epimerase [Acidimicrobiales bacterium]
MGKRVLVTGLGTFWGGRVAQALERDPDIEVIVGLDTTEPSVELDRTEFVRADENYSILARLVKAARIDTILHTFLVVDSTEVSPRVLHESNVIGTMNLLAAASASGSTVRSLIVKSSTHVYGSNPEDPVWFTEETRRSRPPRTLVESSLLEVEGYLRDFAADRADVSVTVLRFSNVLGPDIVTPLACALELPMVPCIAGYDPRLQFVHEDDVVRSMLFALEHDVPGVFNVAGDGLLPWSEVARMCGKRLFPLPPIGTGLAARALKLARTCDLPPEALEVLRHGRGVDTRQLRRHGFRYDYTSAGAVEHFWQAVRLRETVGEVEPIYRYERDVEAFFRHSPAVVRDEAP